MKAHHTNFLNSIVLITFSVWAYIASDNPSVTAFIPAIFGIALLSLNNGVKNENKIIAHIAVVLTLVLAVALAKPLSGALARNDASSIFRVTVMIATTLLSLAYFVKSFIDARRRRAQ